MRSSAVRVILAFMVLTAVVAPVRAGSIWARRARNSRSLYADDTARKIGDTLTIQIIEASKVDNKAKRDLKKEVDRSTTWNGEVNIDHILPSIPGFTMAAESSNQLTGKADYKDERNFTDRISVVVIDVLPNGNLVVKGSRSRSIAGDIQHIEVSGIVRPGDISFGNVISSQQVAEFRIISKNSGVADPYTKPGWLGGIFDIIWPF